MKQFYNSFALIEEGRYDREKTAGFHSFDKKNDEDEEIDSDQENKIKNKKEFDEKKIEKLIQTKLDKAMLDPNLANKWLESRRKDKE